jgi:DNA-binding Lrp family transcriptional regulator
MALEDLDKTDRKILAQLDRNARITYSELGKRIRVAKETVKYRVKNLEKQGIIKGYYTAINFSKIGYSFYRLYLRLQNASPEIEKEIIRHLERSPYVVVFYRTNGPYHIALGILAKGNYEFEEFWMRLNQRFSEYFSAYQFSILTEYVEYPRQYLSPSQSAEKKLYTTFKKSENIEIDDLDRAMLVYLSDNARASLVALAKKLKVSVVTARYHLKKLINNQVIVGFRPLFNLRALGREYYKVDIFFKKFEKEKELREHILSHHDVTYSERSIITSDLEFDVETKNFESFIAMIRSFKKKFPDEIRDYSYYSLIKNYKMKFSPEL